MVRAALCFRVRPLRVYLEHSAGRHNRGDDAMLWSAAGRVVAELGPCELRVPEHASGRLPALPMAVERVPSLQRFADSWVPLALAPIDVLRRMRGRAGVAVSPAAGWPARCLLAAAWAGLEAAAAWARRGLPSPRGLRRALAALEGCDLLYVVGDNALNDFNAPGVLGRRWLCREARRRGALVVLASQGIGPAQTEWARAQLAGLLRDADVVSLRDHDGGAGLLSEMAPPSLPWREAADETLALADASPAEVDRFLEGAGLHQGAAFLAVHFRATDCTRDTRGLVPRLAGILDRLAAALPYRLAFFPMSDGPDWGHDADVARALRAAMVRPERMSVLDASVEPPVLRGAVGRARFSVGLSYHVHVFTLAHDRPALVLYTGPYYGAKSEGLVRTYGPPSAALDLDRVPDDEVVDRALQIEARWQEACAHNAQVNARLREPNRWTLHEAQRLLRERVTRAAPGAPPARRCDPRAPAPPR